MERVDVPSSSGGIISLSTNKDDDNKIEALLVELWQRHLPILLLRLDLLDQVAAEASSGDLTDTARLEGLSVAHKLAGNLGMFGYHDGTEPASKLEQILKAPTPETLARLPGLTADLRNTLASGL